MQIESELAYILHQRPYKDTSAILDVLTENHGRIHLIAKGAKRPKSSFRGVIQLFQPLRISYAGRGDLKTLTDAELASTGFIFAGKVLYCGFYLNELLVRLTPLAEPQSEILHLYEEVLAKLSEHPEKALRYFEFNLFSLLGYGLDFSRDIKTNLPIKSESYYQLILLEGFTESHFSQEGYLGEILFKIEAMQWDSPFVLKQAKHLARMIVDYLLGSKSLKSRDYFELFTAGSKR